MADYRLSIAAEEDVQGLYQFSQILFGPRQTDIHMKGLGRAFQNLAQTPGMGRSAENLQRVLHGRMDFASRL